MKCFLAGHSVTALSLHQIGTLAIYMLHAEKFYWFHLYSTNPFVNHLCL